MGANRGPLARQGRAELYGRSRAVYHSGIACRLGELGYLMYQRRVVSAGRARTGRLEPRQDGRYAT